MKPEQKLPTNIIEFKPSPVVVKKWHSVTLNQLSAIPQNDGQILICTRGRRRMGIKIEEIDDLIEVLKAVKSAAKEAQP